MSIAEKAVAAYKHQKAVREAQELAAKEQRKRQEISTETYRLKMLFSDILGVELDPETVTPVQNKTVKSGLVWGVTAELDGYKFRPSEKLNEQLEVFLPFSAKDSSEGGYWQFGNLEGLGALLCQEREVEEFRKRQEIGNY